MKITIKDIFNVLIAVSLIGITIITGYKYKELEKANEVLKNNIKAYENELVGLQDSLSSTRTTYRFTISELNKTNDKIVKELDSVRKSLKIKDKELKELRNFKTTIKTDTIVQIVMNDSCEFKSRIEYNPQTIFSIESSRVNGKDTLIHSADISASFMTITYIRKEWKEPKFFKRLFLFKWGKYSYEENTLLTDNNIIRINDFKVIKIEE